MSTVSKNTESVEVTIPVKAKLSALWITLLFLYIYADIISLFKPGVLAEVMAGRMGPLPVTQESLLAAAILMLIPALMVYLSLALKPQVDRWVNIVVGLLYTAVNIGILVRETWAFYIVFVIVEMALTLLIVAHAWNWRHLGKRHLG